MAPFMGPANYRSKRQPSRPIPILHGCGGRTGRRSRAESKNRNSAIGLWVVAIFVNAIVFPIAASIVPKLWRTSNPKAFFPLAFCVVGVVLAGAAIRASIRRKRFGQTYFEFASLPFSPGRLAEGHDSLALQHRRQTWHRPAA